MENFPDVGKSCLVPQVREGAAPANLGDIVKSVEADFNR